MSGRKETDGKEEGGPSGAASRQSVLEIRSLDRFESEVIECEIPVVVDFWGSRCGPCKSMAPAFLASAETFEGKAKFVKVNTESSAEVARSFNIRSVPTLVVFYQGDVFDVHVGATPKPQLDAMVRRVLDRHEGVGLLDKIKRFVSGGS